MDKLSIYPFFLLLINALSIVASSDCDDDDSQEKVDECDKDHEPSTGFFISIIGSVLFGVIVLILFICVCKKYYRCENKTKASQGSIIELSNNNSGSTMGFNNYIYESNICTPSALGHESTISPGVHLPPIYYVRSLEASQKTSEYNIRSPVPEHETPPSYEEAISMNPV